MRRCGRRAIGRGEKETASAVVICLRDTYREAGEQEGTIIMQRCLAQVGGNCKCAELRDGEVVEILRSPFTQFFQCSPEIAITLVSKPVSEHLWAREGALGGTFVFHTYLLNITTHWKTTWCSQNH